MTDTVLPAGEPAIRVLAMPADTNPNGDIFGGWLMSQMDVAGALVAIRRCRGRVATIAVDAMTFTRPVYVGDQVSVYGTLERVGRTSIAVRVEAFATRGRLGETVPVTAGLFTYVAIDENRKPRLVDPEPASP
ncbi:MAG: acyl-CoA thioesterase [Alphaproteobacteria bacterium]|nr:acyl-CoA thioesterase [Alphaproteobacteria bacterium]